MEECKHISAIGKIKKSVDICEACIKLGDDWLHLRTCQTCGVTLCCDESPNQHASKHFHATEHPVVTSAEPDEKWMWCYVDEVFVEYS